MGTISALYLRNENAASKYRKAAEMTEDESLITFLNSLADFRSSLSADLQQLMDDMPQSANTPSSSARSYLSKIWEDFCMAIDTNNRTKISRYCEETEESLIKEYKKALEQSDIPMDIHDQLEKQNRHLLDVKRRVERMDIVPMLKNNGF